MLSFYLRERESERAVLVTYADGITEVLLSIKAEAHLAEAEESCVAMEMR